MEGEIQCRYFIVRADEPDLQRYLAPYVDRMERFKELDKRTCKEMGATYVAVNNYNGVTGWYFNVTPGKPEVVIPDGLHAYSKYSSDYKCKDGTELKIYTPTNKKFKASRQYHAYLKELNELYCDIPYQVIKYFDMGVKFFVANLRVAKTVAVQVGDWWLFAVPWPDGNDCKKVFSPKLKEIKKSQFVAILEEGTNPDELQ